MIERVRLDGFRTLNPLELRGLRPFNLLLGPNSSGKSNFLRALQFVGLIARGHELSWIESYIENESYSPFSPLGGLRPWGSESWLFAYEIELRHQDNILICEGALDLNQRAFVRENIKKKGIGVRGKWAYVVNKEGETLKVLSEDFKYESRNDVRWSVFPVLKNSGIISSYIMDIQELADIIVLERNILTKRRHSLLNIKKNLYETMDYAFHNPEGAIGIKRVFRELEGLGIIWDKQWGFTFMPEGLSGNPVSLDGLSDGALRLLWWLCWAYMEKRPSVFLIEEIDNGLNPMRFRKVVLLALEMATREDGPTQFFVTTHNPYIVDEFTEAILEGIADIIIFKREDGFRTSAVSLWNTLRTKKEVEKLFREMKPASFGEAWLDGILESSLLFEKSRSE
jgi:predicted ATP-dependent endonuclease of OLD family